MSVITKKYTFAHYYRLIATLSETSHEVQSERLSLLMSEAIQAVQKLLLMCEEKEAHLSRRAQQNYAVVRRYAQALVVSAGYPASGYHLLEHSGDCDDDNPCNWATNCPRCLCIAMGRADDRPLPPFETPDYLKPVKPKKTRASQKMPHPASTCA
jgi:hypothetical protein